MMIRSFAVGLGFSVLLGLQVGCASSASPAQAPKTLVAADMAAPEIAPPAEQADFTVEYAPNGEKENTMTKDRNGVSTAMRPQVASKKNHLHDADGTGDANDASR